MPQTSVEASLRGRGRRGGVVGARGRGRKMELVPILERLRPRQVQGIKVTGRVRIKSSSPNRTARKKEATHLARSILDPVITLKQLVSPTHNDREGVINSPNVQVEGSTKEDKHTVENEQKGLCEDAREGVHIRKDEKACLSTTGEGRTGSECAVPLLPPVPKLRRTHATFLSNDYVGPKDQVVRLMQSQHREKPNMTTTCVNARGNEEMTRSKEPPLSQSVDVAHTSTNKIRTKRIQRKRGRPRRAVIDSSSQMQSPSTSAISSMESTCTPANHLVEDSSKLLPPEDEEEISDNVTVTEAFLATDSDNSGMSPGDTVELEYPQPSTNYQKMQRKLARQKQLEDMRAREMAFAREERFLRRHGLSKSPEKCKQKHLTWKEETDLVEVFVYSPCSSRGSTLEPDDIPELL